MRARTARRIIARAVTAERMCPHCRASNPLGVGGKCVTCKKRLPEYCFACYAAVADENATVCPACGRRRWVFGDFAELACAFEKGRRRQHRYMTALMKGGKAMHEWRCMTCFSDETRTDASTHFPDRPLAQV
jgi:hypothetical protein